MNRKKKELPRVFIFAAGLGTRLRPYTSTKPKALVEVGGKPMLHYTLDLLEKYGFSEILLNVHHFAEQLKDFIYKQNKIRSLKIEIQDESNLLLGSGGAIAQAKSWLYENQNMPTALYWNPDGLLKLNLLDFFSFHQREVRDTGILASLSLLSHPEVGKRYHAVYFDKETNKVLGFGRQSPAVLQNHEAMHFAGGYYLEKEACSSLPSPGTVCDVAKEIWFPLAKQNKFAGYLYQGPYQDLGESSDIPQANERIAKKEFL